MTSKPFAFRHSPLLAAICLILSLIAAPLAVAQSQSGSSSSPYAFEVEAINPGLGEEPAGAYYDTPQATMESFVDASEEEDWQTAAHALDLGFLSPAQQASVGPILARELYEVVNRSMIIDWNSLPDRPDAVDAMSSDKDPMAGAQRRNLLLARIDLPDRSVSIRLSRIQAPGGEPQWKFARQTVQNVPALYKIYGPTKLEEKLPGFLRKQAFWTLAWWEVIALPIVLLIAIAAAILTWVAIRNFGRRYDESVIGSIMNAVKTPAALFAAAGTFAFVRSIVFTFSGAVNMILDPLQTLLIVLGIAAVFLAVIEGILDTVVDRSVEDIGAPENESDRNYYTTLSAVRRLAIVLLILVALGIVLIQSNLTSTLGFSLIAGAGLLTLVIAFAARRLLGDIMASMQIAFARTARIGDAVEFKGDWSYVEKIGFTHLRLRTWDDRRLIVPVEDFVQSSFENWTKTDATLIKLAHLRLDHRADVDALRREFEKFVQDDDDVIEKDEAKLQVVDHDETGMKLRCVARAPDPARGWAMHCRMREYMLAAAARLDGATQNEPSHAYLPREREVRMDLSREDEAG